MKTRDEVSVDKIRGGFYTPPALVRHVVDRLAQLLGGKAAVRLLEPSIGDGRFLDGLQASALDIDEVLGVELVPTEAAAARERLARLDIAGEVVNASALRWALGKAACFDGVIGNLPFVRFQFVSDADRADADLHAKQLGVSIGGVSNLWLPMLLAALRLLKDGGVFALVLPTECLTGVSAGSARDWLTRNCTGLRCDLYPAGSFPGALQEVLVLSGRRCAADRGDRILEVAQHRLLHSSDRFVGDQAVVTRHPIEQPKAGWTRYLMSTAAAAALHEFQNLPSVVRMTEVARFEVATVTGANGFFCLPGSAVDRFELRDLVRPLLARIRNAPGLIFTDQDYARSVELDAPAFIFDSRLAAHDRLSHRGLESYLAEGERQRLPERYKCRIRTPWWQIPYMRTGELLLSKRSHRFHRMVVNGARAITTDTIYRGSMRDAELPPSALAAAFHNSGTLLCSEVEGRYFGGGVLELVPSEVGRLSVPRAPALAADLAVLDQVTRAASVESADGLEALVTETDLLLVKADIGVTDEMINALAAGRAELLGRRLERAEADRSVELDAA